MKPNTSAFGPITYDGGKRPKHINWNRQEASDSDTSLKFKEDVVRFLFNFKVVQIKGGTKLRGLSQESIFYSRLFAISPQLFSIIF